MLSAGEAGWLSERALSGGSEAIRPFLEHIECRVREAAGCGRRRIDHPFAEAARRPAVGQPEAEVLAAVRRAVEAEGYAWTSHPDPDPGHPCSRPYDSISW